MPFKRRKSKSRRAADALATSAKTLGVARTAKGVRKAAKGTAAYQVAKRKPAAAYQAAKRKPLLRRAPIVLGAGVAAFAAAKLIGGGQDESAPASA